MTTTRPRGDGVTEDPFERAAKREEREEIRREMRKQWLVPGVRWASRGMTTAIVSFGIPYVIWGLIRAAGFDFGEPTMPQSIIRFFFGKWYVFGIYTGWMLFLLWSWAITRTTMGGRAPWRS
jgi:hypothetical protein